MRLALLIVALAAAAVAQASAATLHVSTNGTGHACSEAAPCALAVAAETANARASASLLLAAGEYAGVALSASSKLQALTVVGKGKVSLAGAGAAPCLSFRNGGVLTLKHLTFTGCHGAVHVEGSLEADSCAFVNGTGLAVSVAATGASKKQFTADLTSVTCEGGTAGSCLALAAESDAKDANTLKATVTGFKASGNRGDAVITVTGNPKKSGAVLLDLTESSLVNNTARGLLVTNAVADKHVWAVIVSSCNITGNTMAGNATGAGVYVKNSAVGVPETLLVRNTNGARPAAQQVALVAQQIDCDAKALKLGSCQNCGVDKKTGDFEESTVSAIGEASCAKCFKKHNSAYPSKAGSSKTGHIGRGCVQFMQTVNGSHEHFAVCVDECPPPGEDLSFGAADVVGLAALGVATLAVFNCLVTTRSPEHYAKLRKEEEQAGGTAPLLDHAGSSAPIATGVATTYAEDVDPNGTVQSV